MSKVLCLGCMNYHEEGTPCPCGFNEETYEYDNHHLRPGVVLHNRFLVGKVIGEGGFGITYVGRDQVLDLKVAIKEFYMAGYVSRNTTYSQMVDASMGGYTELFLGNKEKFLTEARTLARFANEDGIVGIRDFFEENNTAYIIMDFLEGKTLKTMLKENGPFRWGEVLRIFQPLLKSLDVVHKEGLIHRDISPDNIMMGPDGKVKLLDFGAARAIEKKDLRSLSMVLKPGYAPVEQYRMNGNQGPWTDVYALCSTMYNCITGTIPPDSMDRIFEDNVKSAHELVPECPEYLSDVLMKGMAVRQEDRYQSVSELYRAVYQAEQKPAAPEVKPVVEPVKPAAPAEPEEDDRTVFAGRIPDAKKPEVRPTEPAVEPKPAPQPSAPAPKPVVPPMVNKPSVPKAPEPSAPVKNEEPKEKKPVNKAVIGIICAVVVALILGIVGVKALGNKRNLPEENDSALAGTSYRYMSYMNSVQTSYDNCWKSYDEIRTSFPDELFPISCELDGTHLELPFEYSVLSEMGWEAVDPADLKHYLAPGDLYSKGVMLMNMKTGSEIQVAFWNLSDKTARLDEISVYEISTDTAHFSKGSSTLQVGSAVFGETIIKDLRKVYQGYDNSDSKNSVHIGDGYAHYSFYADKGENSPVGRIFINGEYASGSQIIEVPAKKELKVFPEQETAFADLIQRMNPRVVATWERNGKTYDLAAGSDLQFYLNQGFTLLQKNDMTSLPSGYFSESGEFQLKMDERTTLNILLGNPSMNPVELAGCIVTNIEIKSAALLAEDNFELLNIDTGHTRKIVKDEQIDLSDFFQGEKFTTNDSGKIAYPKGEGSCLVNNEYTHMVSLGCHDCAMKGYQNMVNEMNK